MKFSMLKPPLPLLIATLALLPACGNNKFNAQKHSETAVANQYKYTKAKIDIVLFQDNSDSMRTPLAYLRPQMESFLNSLGSRWDVHFVVMPLLQTKNLSARRIVADDCSTITGGYSCLSTAQANVFNSLQDDSGWIRSINSAAGSNDFGLQNIQTNLSQPAMANSGFLRPDAALAVIVFSNGTDISGISYYNRGDGVMLPDYNSATSQNSFNGYYNYLSGLKGGSGLSKFYSVVAQSYQSNCYGGTAWEGVRYKAMSEALLSRSFNLCSAGLGSVLNEIASHLTSVVETYIFNYTVLQNEPIVSSIVVRKNGQVIPQDSQNGWIYEEGFQTKEISYFPTLSNKRSGYFIRMNGTAEYKGSDIITVDYERR
jgi:hypothetical protein